jgi:hypothetical protein
MEPGAHSADSSDPTAAKACSCADSDSTVDDADTAASLSSADEEPAAGDAADQTGVTHSASQAAALAAAADARATEEQTLAQLYYNLQWPDEDMPAPTNGDADDWFYAGRETRRGSLSSSGPANGVKVDRMDVGAINRRIVDGIGHGPTIPMLPAYATPLPQPPSMAIESAAERARRLDAKRRAARMVDLADERVSGLGCGREEHMPVESMDFSSIGAVSAEGGSYRPMSTPTSDPVPVVERTRQPSLAEIVAVRVMRQNSFLAQQAPDVRPQVMSPEMQAILMPSADPRDAIFHVTGRRSSSSTAPPMPSSRVLFPAPTLWRDNWKGDYGYSRL